MQFTLSFAAKNSVEDMAIFFLLESRVVSPVVLKHTLWRQFFENKIPIRIDDINNPFQS
jgi:hypothetical protein